MGQLMSQLMGRCFLALVWGLAGASAVSAQGVEEQAVIRAVQAVFDAMESRDGDALRASMLQEGHFVSVNESRTRWTSRDDFADGLADAARPYHERMWDPEVRIDGPVASVWAPYDFYLGAEFSDMRAREPAGTFTPQFFRRWSASSTSATASAAITRIGRGGITMDDSVASVSVFRVHMRHLGPQVVERRSSPYSTLPTARLHKFRTRHD